MTAAPIICTLPPGHPHGEARHYGQGCKCEDTRAAKAANLRRRRRENAYGTRPYARRVPAGPAREHLLNALGGQTLTSDVAVELGVSLATLRRLIKDPKDTGSKGRLTTVTIQDEEKVLAWKPRTVFQYRPGFIPAAGTARRLQALAALGWPVARLEPLIPGKRTPTQARSLQDVLAYTRRGRTDLVKEATAAQVKVLYDRLWNTTPEHTNQRQKEAITKTRNLATRHKWALPMAWDEGAIDNPDAKPHRAHRRREVAVMTGSVEDLVELVEEHGLDWEEAASRAGYRSVDSAQSALKRYRRGRANTMRANQDLAA